MLETPNGSHSQTVAVRFLKDSSMFGKRSSKIDLLGGDIGTGDRYR